MNIYAPTSVPRSTVRAAAAAARQQAASSPDTAGLPIRVRRHPLFCYAPRAFTYGRVQVFVAFQSALYPN